MLCLAQSTTDATQVRIVSVDAGSCGPGEFAAFSQAEVTQALGNPFYLDAASAISISQAILLVWAVAWVFRAIRKQLESMEPIHDTE